MRLPAASMGISVADVGRLGSIPRTPVQVRFVSGVAMRCKSTARWFSIRLSNAALTRAIHAGIGMQRDRYRRAAGLGSKNGFFESSASEFAAYSQSTEAYTAKNANASVPLRCYVRAFRNGCWMCWTQAAAHRIENSAR